MRKVIFLHIPKTGGGAFDDRLRAIFDNPAPRHSWEDARQKEMSYWRDYDYIAGHYPLSFVDQFAEYGVDVVTVMLFRDPVARVLSHWAYVHKRGYHRDKPFTKWLKQATFDEWLNSDRTHAPYNLQTKFLHDRRFHPNSPLTALARIDVLGIQNRDGGLQDAMDILCGVIHKQPPQINNIANVSYGMPLYDLSPSILALIQRLNSVDIDLYEAIVGIIDKRVLLAEVE